MKHLPHQLRSSGRRGFTTIELLVVIAIIAIVASIGVTVASRVYRQSSITQTRLKLNALKAMAASYQLKAKSAVNHLIAVTTPINWNQAKRHNDPPGATTTGNLIPNTNSLPENKEYAVWGSRFLWVARQIPSLEQSIAALGHDNVKDIDGDGFLDLLDQWGHKMIYVAYVDRSDAYTEDDFLPERDTPYFVSPGLDGEFGDMTKNSDTVEFKQTQDNIYSYELE